MQRPVEPAPKTPEDLLITLERTTRRRQTVDLVLLELVRELRDMGVSWNKIGQAQGVTGQAARQKYSKHL